MEIHEQNAQQIRLVPSIIYYPMKTLYSFKVVRVNFHRRQNLLFQVSVSYGCHKINQNFLRNFVRPLQMKA